MDTDSNIFFNWMPPEWVRHYATILIYPTNNMTWNKSIILVQQHILDLAFLISEYENVYLIIDPIEFGSIKYIIESSGARRGTYSINCLSISNNDSWVRDCGPNFILSSQSESEYTIAVNDWGYNAWGEKYPPWDADDDLTKEFIQCTKLGYRFEKDMVLEGGSIDVNGHGVLLTSKSCLLNPNRNPSLTQDEIEEQISEALGVKHILWLEKGIVGDDTDGHIDDFIRFVAKDTIVCSYEDNIYDENYYILKDAYHSLIEHPVILKNSIKVVKIPMPPPLIHDDLRLPASYANFYFINGAILLPAFNDKLDEEVRNIFQGILPDREVILVDSRVFVRGLGGIHCLTQQVYSNECIDELLKEMNI